MTKLPTQFSSLIASPSALDKFEAIHVSRSFKNLINLKFTTGDLVLSSKYGNAIIDTHCNEYNKYSIIQLRTLGWVAWSDENELTLIERGAFRQKTPEECIQKLAEYDVFIKENTDNLLRGLKKTKLFYRNENIPIYVGESHYHYLYCDYSSYAKMNNLPYENTGLEIMNWESIAHIIGDKLLEMMEKSIFSKASNDCGKITINGEYVNKILL